MDWLWPNRNFIFVFAVNHPICSNSMNLLLTDYMVFRRSMILNGRRTSSTFWHHARMTICWPIAVNIIQINVIDSKEFVYVGLNSLTFWIEMGSDSLIYILNTIVRTIPRLFIGLRLDRGLKHAWVDPIGFLFLTNADLRILLFSVNRKVFLVYSLVVLVSSCLSSTVPASRSPKLPIDAFATLS